MGKTIFISLALIFVFQIFRSKGVKKLSWYFAGILFFPHTVELMENPSLPFPRLLILSLLLTTILQRKSFKTEFVGFPLKNQLLFIIIIILSIGVFDERLNIFLKIYRPFYYILENFVAIFLTYYYVNSLKDIKYIYNKIILFFLPFSLYGISNFFTRKSEYFNFIVEVYGGRNFAEANMEKGVDRFRITSFSWHAIVYGFLIYTTLLIQIFLFTTYRFLKRNKLLYILIFVLLLVNLILVNSRTPLFSFAIGISIYLAFAVSLRKKMRIALFGLLLFGFALNYIPSTSRLIEESINTFSSKGSNLEGSSIEMRQVQLAASVAIFNQNPVFGNGFGFIVEDLNYSSNKDERESNTDFAGFESYIYKLLIEQGIVGIIGNLVFFICWLIWLIREYKYVTWLGQRMIVLSVSMIVAFLLFIIGTGELNTFLVFMSIMGINTKLIILSKKSNQYHQFQNFYKHGAYKI